VGGLSGLRYEIRDTIDRSRSGNECQSNAASQLNVVRSSATFFFLSVFFFFLSDDHVMLYC